MKKVFLGLIILLNMNTLYSNIVDNVGLDLSYDTVNINATKYLLNNVYIGVSAGVHFSDDFILNDPNVNLSINYVPLTFKFFKPLIGIQYSYIYLIEPTFENSISAINVYTGGYFPIYKNLLLGITLGYRYGKSSYSQEKRNDYFHIEHNEEYELFPLYIKLLINYRFL